MRTLFSVILSVFITLLFGLALGQAENIPACTDEPYGYGVAFSVLLLMLVPAIIGFLVGLVWDEK